MASGFVVLRDGRCLSVVQPIHDAVLRSIVESLPDASPFRAWLGTQVPMEDDIELGYAFVRAADGEHVSRTLDTRALTETNRKLFEDGARSALPIESAHASAEYVSRALGRLRAMLDLCDQGSPPLELSDWRVEAPPCDQKIGPGWTSFA